MIIVFADVADHTAHLQRVGDAQGRADVTRTLAAIETALGTGGTLTRPNAPAGDGIVLLGASGITPGVLAQAVLYQQFAESPLRARLSIGLGEPEWTGVPWADGSTVTGSEVNLIARILGECDPGGLVVTSEVYGQFLLKHPRLREGAHRRAARLKGFAEPVTFWAIPTQRDRPMSEESSERLGRSRNGISQKWLLGILTTLVFAGGAGWLTFIQAQIEEVRSEQVKERAAGSETKTDTAVIKGKVDRAEKDLQEIKQDQREQGKKLDELLRRVK